VSVYKFINTVNFLIINEHVYDFLDTVCSRQEVCCLVVMYSSGMSCWIVLTLRHCFDL